MGTSDQYKVFDSILDWSPTLSIVLGPPGVPISLKSVFLETPCMWGDPPWPRPTNDDDDDKEEDDCRSSPFLISECVGANLSNRDVSYWGGASLFSESEHKWWWSSLRLSRLQHYVIMMIDGDDNDDIGTLQDVGVFALPCSSVW